MTMREKPILARAIETQKENCIAYIFQTEIILKQPEFSKALKICNKERVQEKDLFAFSACLHT